MQAHFENQLMPSYDKTYWQAWLTCTNKTATQSNSTSNTWPAISLDSSQSGVPNSTGTLSHLDPGFSVTALRGTVHPWFHPLPVGLGTSRVSFTVSKKSCRVQCTVHTTITIHIHIMQMAGISGCNAAGKQFLYFACACFPSYYIPYTWEYKYQHFCANCMQ